MICDSNSDICDNPVTSMIIIHNVISHFCPSSKINKSKIKPIKENEKSKVK